MGRLATAWTISLREEPTMQSSAAYSGMRPVETLHNGWLVLVGLMSSPADCAQTLKRGMDRP